MLIETIESSKVLTILFEKGLLAMILLLAAFLFNFTLQRYKLRGEAANEIAADRAKAYVELWKVLAEVRPLDDEDIPPKKVKEIESVLKHWYHNQANALYMSFKAAKCYMLLRQALQITPINAQLIRKRVSLLRTQLKVDCGIYSQWDAKLSLPKPKK